MNKPRFSLDTNVLIYAVDSLAGEKHTRALQFVDQAVDEDCVLTLQVLSEFYFATTRKGKVPLLEAEQQVNDWQMLFPIITVQPAFLNLAMKLAREHCISFWDALLLETVSAHGVTHLLSEDFQERRVISGVTICNPFEVENPFKQG
jgi:predicted nucleic acid-binding protein